MSDPTHTGGRSDQAKGIVYEGPHAHHDHIHVTPALPMTIVFIILLILTVFTVLTAHYIDLPGTGNLILALIIATIKGTLVMAYFMHLKYDKGMNLIIVYATFFGVVLFLGLTMADLAGRDAADKLVANEITAGGKLSLNSTLPRTADMNIADLSVEDAKAKHGNHDHAEDDHHEDEPAHDDDAESH